MIDINVMKSKNKNWKDIDSNFSLIANVFTEMIETNGKDISWYVI